MSGPDLPPRQGLYDPAFEHDACGFGFVVDLKARASHDIIRKALQVLLNLEHRGATGSEKNTGDGAGLLTQVPHPLPGREVSRPRIRAPRAGRLRRRDGLPPAGGGEPAGLRAALRGDRRGRKGRRVLGWRDVPTDDATLGPTARASQPVIRQLFVARGEGTPEGDAFERKLYVIRRLVEKAISRSAIPGRGHFYVASLSAPDARLQGDAERRPARGLLPGPAGRGAHRVPRDGPLALLDEHLPELGARPPVPVHLAQRRDQHAPRERQLDAGPAADVLVDRSSETTSGRSSPSSTPTGRTRRCSTTSSSSSSSRGARSRTRS